MKTFDFDTYKLCLSYNPCDLFNFFNRNYLHGLSFHACLGHTNNSNESYIAGMCNEIPKSWLWNNKEQQVYNGYTPRFVFINLNRCNTELETITLIYHELLHQSFFIHDHDMDSEEKIISWAEEETKKVYEIVKNELQIHNSTKKNKELKEAN
jgi:hypothetical protein